MSKLYIKFHNVSFEYETSYEKLFEDISIDAAAGWTGVVGANGTGKSTLLKLATEILQPNEGYINMPANTIYCEQRTDNIVERFPVLLNSNSKTSFNIKNQLGIKDDWGTRWNTLSHGERKRAQIGVALWLEPDVLAIDEPTNHLDSQARNVIEQALLSFRGVGLLVSHDRELLDSLCYQCIIIEPPEVIVRKGNYSQAVKEVEKEQLANQKQYLQQKKVYKKLHCESARRKEVADQAHKRSTKRGIAKKDHDAKEKKDRARMTGKDIVGGKLHRQIQGRLAKAQEDLDVMKLKKNNTMGIWLPGAVSKRNYILNLPDGSISLGKEKRLLFPELIIQPKDRIAITGENGAGKSTLLEFLIKSLNVPDENITYVPQEIDAEQSKIVLEKAQNLPNNQLGHLMTIVSRLGSRPHRLLDSAKPSPGETRKLLLALGMTSEPHIIIMDEPTNHLDLPSIECLEKALADCPCCLILVSHDKRFLNELTNTRWKIARSEEHLYQYNLRVKYK